MRLVIEPDFLPVAACEALMARIDNECAPSTVLGPPVEGHRTSYTAYLGDPAITERIADLLGVDPEHAEAIQGQRYDVGQEFKPHWDAFHDDSQGGQRSWSAMIYLNDVEAGGETGFPKIGMDITPRQGLLIAWLNLRSDGSIDRATMHQGKPVIEGRKYILTQWFR